MEKIYRHKDVYDKLRFLSDIEYSNFLENMELIRKRELKDIAYIFMDSSYQQEMNESQINLLTKYPNVKDMEDAMTYCKYHFGASGTFLNKVKCPCKCVCESCTN